ncbi:unnamed protein product [Rotaria magnacalcarata]|uniref:Uncharacterized protein n=1 Tax=Rotaria magnacalcarata TaxID=392030 RepID=A0A820NK98_9BILA|nr:unnamed protein product [Rotaria magnacalcarata]CAF2041055.1 unnamed protein product [Rotaria magnacalcarata]CAF4383877.1 unnamed protein product [Rotaria magnacalcarata]CAF4388174.1 unnamed protein product [Rotaria magnacalcarata]
MKRVVLQFRHLPLLRHFTLINCHLIFHRNTLRYVLNRIWHLPKPTHCHLDLHFQYTSEFCIPTIRSKSIEHLCIENISLNSNQLSRLFRCTLNLQRLTSSIDKFSKITQFHL